MFNTSTPYSPENREAIVNILNKRIANLLVLYSQAKNAHWNSKGPLFYELHLLFDRIADGLLGKIDPLAERLTSMGGVVTGTVHQAASSSSIGPQAKVVSGMGFLDDLRSKVALEYSEVVESTKSLLVIGDNATANMLSDEEEFLGTTLYLLESHIQNMPS